MPTEIDRTKHILNLGAGVQSTTLYLLFLDRLIKRDGEPIILDAAIFADTGEEPDAVYSHLEWLMSLGGNIIIRSKGKLGEHLLTGTNSTGQRFASIPAYTKAPGDAREGRLRRQCSKEYKSEVVERTIRRDVLGMLPRQRVPKGTRIYQYFGISLDESGRAKRIKDRMERTIKWSVPVFPLIEASMTRADCRSYLADRVPHHVPRSACVFCPYKSDAEWVRLKEDRTGWERAVEIDTALRVPGNIVNRGTDKPIFLHRSCVPLEEVQFDTRPDPRKNQLALSFSAECEGMCGL